MAEQEKVMAKPNFEVPPEQEVVDKKPDEEKGKKKKSKLRKILEWVITGLFGAVLVCSIGFTVYVNANKNKTNYLFGGYLYPVVLTDSMCPDYPVDSVLVIKKVDPSEIKVGDDVMFYYDFSDGNGQIKVTHRIVEARKVEGHGGASYRFVAHGINKESKFCGYYDESIGEWYYNDCTGQMQYFSDAEVIGKVVGKSTILSLFYRIVSSTWGLVIIVLIPALYLVITSVVDIFKKLPDDDEETPQLAGAGAAGGTGTIKKVTRADGSDPLAGMSDEEKERLKKQLLEQMLKGKGGNK